MRVAAIICLIVIASVGVSAQDKPQIDRGIKVYADQKCSICHAIDGKGNAKGPLDGVGTKLTVAEIREWMADPAAMTKKTNATRKPPMRAYPNLPKEDVEAVVSYLASLKKK